MILTSTGKCIYNEKKEHNSIVDIVKM